MNASEILAIGDSNPEKLYTKSNYELEYKRLRKKWHPDYCSDPLSADVFDHIATLYSKAKFKIGANSWGFENSFKFQKEGKEYIFRYLKSHNIDIGTMYIAHKYVCFVIGGAYKHLSENGISTIKKLKYGKGMKSKFKDYFPRMNPVFNYGGVIIFNKDPDAISLKDFLKYSNNEIEPKTVAWIGSGLFNIACFLKYNGLTHNGIDLDSVFINPKTHNTYLYGGWWFSSLEGLKLKGMPSKLANGLPSKALIDKKSKYSYDVLSIKNLIIELMGDSSRNGSKFLMSGNIPKPLLQWVRDTTLNDDTFKVYESWQNVLKESFGKPKFIHCDVTFNDVYVT